VVYTISNSCEEDATVNYNDDAKKMGRLILCLTEAGRTEDLIKAANDTSFRNQLIKEFNL